MCIARRAEVVAMKLVFELGQALLVRVVIEVVLAMQVLHEGRNSLHHSFRREVVDIIFEELPYLFNVLYWYALANATKPCPCGVPSPWNSLAKNKAGARPA